jgi:hypothetical protein
VRRAAPADIGVGGCPLATGLRDASVEPAYLAGPTKSDEDRTGSPRHGGGGSACLSYYILNVLLSSLKAGLVISLHHEVLGDMTASGLQLRLTTGDYNP